MNLNVFIPIDTGKIAKLPFIEATVPYIYKETKFTNGPIHYGAVHVIGPETYDKLETKFAGTDYKIEAGMKLYAFPNCKVPQFKIKDILKSLNATLTNDWSTATGFIGSENAFKIQEKGKDTMNVLGGYTYYNCYYTENTHESAIYPELYKTATKTYMNTHATGLGYMGSTDIKFLLPLGAGILYRILSEKLPIISEDSLLNQSTSNCIIDEELYDSLNSMLNSTDDENKSLALHTIANCNIKESIVYIYLIARNYEYDFRHSRFKNIKLFYETANMDYLSKISMGRFISEIDQSLITPYLFQKLVTFEAENIIEDNTIKSDLFDIIIVPKRKFAKYHNNLTFTYELDEE